MNSTTKLVNQYDLPVLNDQQVVGLISTINGDYVVIVELDQAHHVAGGTPRSPRYATAYWWAGESQWSLGEYGFKSYRQALKNALKRADTDFE